MIAVPPEILVVEDQDDLAAVLTEVLVAEGYRVRRACDGRRGLELLEERLPDAVILDVEMPQLTGPELALRMFIRDAGMDAIPVVLVSGIVDFAEVARRVGTPYFLPKPYDLGELLGTLRRALDEGLPPRPQLP